MNLESKQPQPAVETIRRSGGRWSVRLDAAHEAAFPADLFPDYASFVNAPGTPMKDEPRTLIRLLRRDGADTDTPDPSFVLKHYKYPLRSQFRTWYIRSKAHCEFDTLKYCIVFVLPAVTPVACGVERTRAGSVKSCFIVTRHIDEFTCLRNWLRERPSLSLDQQRALRALVAEVGGHLRRLHTARFFLGRLMGKNILVRYMDDAKFDWFLIDQPYARFCKPTILARALQLRDLGAFAGSLYDHGHEAATEAFFEAYLPDPLGATDAALRRRASHGIRIYHNETLPRRMFKRPKRILKNKISEWRGLKK